jgi:anti-sigma factor RsiW
MRTASSQRRTTNWVISIVLAIFLARAAGFTVVRAVILLGQVSPSGTFAFISDTTVVAHSHLTHHVTASTELSAIRNLALGRKVGLSST